MKKTITIIDDNESLVTSLSIQLNLSNYNVNKFICPEKAIEYLTTNPSDGYIIDFKMPKMNGIEFYKDLCSILGKDKLPAIFLTGVEQIEERVLRHTTAGDFVKKPFSYSILIARLEKVMSYFTGFFSGLLGIMLSIIPVAILWQLLTGSLVFNMDVIGNFMGMINGIAGAGFVGLVTLVFIMYFLTCDRCGIPKDCKKK